MEETTRYLKTTKKGFALYFDKALKHRDYLGEYRQYRQVARQLRNIRGAIGTLYVVKHYKERRLPNGKRIPARIVITKFPDMSKIIASSLQKDCRTHFHKAVAFAKEVIADTDLKQAWAARYHIKLRQVYSKALSIYIKLLTKGHEIESALMPGVLAEENMKISVDVPLQPKALIVNATGRVIGLYPRQYKAVGREVMLREDLREAG
jgi:hypothetical protein